jgi:hypothetical protein
MTDTKPTSFTDLAWRDGRPKIAPVQGYAAGIPWSLHLKAYDAYCKKYGSQVALIDLAGRGCRGGFGVNELDMFVPGWRDEVEELGRLRSRIILADKVVAACKALIESGGEDDDLIAVGRLIATYEEKVDRLDGQ